MQRVCRVFKNGSFIGNRCYLKGENDIFKRDRLYLRSFGSQTSGDGGSDDEKSSQKGSESSSSDRKSETIKGNDAKAKLRSLLTSIVEDSKKAAAAGGTTESKGGAINMKLARPEKPKKDISEQVQKTADEIETEKDLGKEMVQAVKDVAKSLEPEDTKVVESELVQKLKTQVGKKVNLSDLFAGMKIDRTPKPATTTSAVDVELSRAHRVRKLLDARPQASRSSDEQRPRDRSLMPRQRRPPPSGPSYVPIDLFGAPPLGIFSAPDDADHKDDNKTESIKLETWDALSARDLKLSVTHPPSNGFEEMILWTEQGKLWKFPIDNEQGLDEEAKVPFHEHVFLEPQIESWCPKKGPIRHFMELVCIGLSKNPFLTIKEKHTQIEWYHQYFKKKAAMIKETGAGEIK